jgi:hypothetical protein
MALAMHSGKANTNLARFLSIHNCFNQKLRYKNGKWEFTFSGEDIHEQLNELGGLEALKLDSSIFIKKKLNKKKKT